MKNVKIITIESDFGAGKKGAKLGPQALLKEIPTTYIENLPLERIVPNEQEESHMGEFAIHIESILSIEKLALQAVETAIDASQTPWIISGDHSNGLVAISAYKNKFPENRLGVIWIDAHADLHSPYTSPSGNMHGMPLAAALGLQSNTENKNKVDRVTQLLWKEMTQLGAKKICPKLLPSDLVFIDIRDLETEEIALLENHSIKHFTPQNRKEIGLQKIIEDTLQHLSHCHHIIVSFDVDSLDPSISCGTGTPVHGGLLKEEAITLLKNFLAIPNLFAFEITEINPLLDRIHPMEKEAAEIVLASGCLAGS